MRNILGDMIQNPVETFIGLSGIGAVVIVALGWWIAL